LSSSAPAALVVTAAVVTAAVVTAAVVTAAAAAPVVAAPVVAAVEPALLVLEEAVLLWVSSAQQARRLVAQVAHRRCERRTGIVARHWC
jgi:hypothetical protein